MDAIARDAAICLRCWTVVVRDGKVNLERATQMCSHLGPAQEVVPAERLRGAVDLLRDAHDRDRLDGSMPSIDWYKRVDAYLNPQPPRGRRP
jgi:hypothetical protein